MKCIATAVARLIAMIAPVSAQDTKLNIALHACVAKAGLQRLPPMVDLDDPAALTLAAKVRKRSLCSQALEHGGQVVMSNDGASA